MLNLMHVVVLVLIIISAFFTLWFRDLLCSIILSSAFSLLLALEFYILLAPDVAIAEAAVGAALDTAIYIIALTGVGVVHLGNGGGQK